MGTAKAMLPWRGRPLLWHQCHALWDFADVVAVVGHQAELIQQAVELDPPARYVVNGGWQDGRSTSVEAGARALAARQTAARAVLVVAVDQPLERSVVDALLAGLDPSRHSYAVPTWEGLGGHPLLMSVALLRELGMATRYARGLRGIVEDHASGAVGVPVKTPAVRFDLNTPADYADARRGNAGGRAAPSGRRR